MASADEIEVQVAYAAPERQIAKTLTLPAGSSVEQAIRASGLLEKFPEIDLTYQRIGVFGEFVWLDECLQGGERVEIYRALIADPKEARRRRAQERKVR
ncbi:MAG TPA: RnfH family protein [Acidiferrobacterales bacterium]|nr:RnfH family protein [Acidiferrobacterales bacterium]